MAVEMSAKERFILSLERNLCKTCGKDSTTAVQIYPSQAWEYYCRECHDNRK
jgi:late competence protein required for DNA uptake (superfamily II DNA/RNA helicase)